MTQKIEMEEANKLVYSNATDTMSDSHLLAPPQEPSRNYRSHSLKTQSQPFLFPPRTKRRTLSLPSTKPIIPPFIVISDYQGNNISEREDGELRCEYHKECMAWYTPVLGFSCSVLIYFCSCALAYYSKAS